MLAVAETLTFSEFQLKYRKVERAYEFWHGRAVPKSGSTWIHGYLQILIARLLEDAGYFPGAEVELRIVPEARPKPDIIATRGKVEVPYPTSAVDVVVEIISTDDALGYLIEKCQSYQRWGFADIYLVHPDSRFVFRWSGQGLEVSQRLAGIEVLLIWDKLDKAMITRQ